MPAIWWLLAGCGWFGGGEAPEVTDAPEAAAEAPDEGPAAPAGAPDVFFFVLDTVRADHTSLCGYDRPTTPTLEALNTAGASVSCQVRAPADWTIPSHASLFTGKTVLEHGAVIAKNSDVALNAYTSVRPLPADLPTLAEHFKGLGYVTVAISANPIVREEAGLMRGFDVHVSGPPRKLAGPGLAAELRTQLRGIDRDKPLFLFVNIFDAHDPYPAIPEDIGWVPAQPEISVQIHGKRQTDASQASRAFLSGELAGAEKDAFLTSVRNGYDHALWRADASLGRILEGLRKIGKLDDGDRLVITSDHGEFLGEKGLLRHGGYLWEPNLRVPLVVVQPDKIEIPSLFSGVDVYHLVRDGKLPETLHAPETISFPNPSADLLPGVRQAARWAGTEKWLWEDGKVRRFDLATDPGEEKGEVVDDAPTAGLAQHERLDALAVPKNEELRQQLEAVGYTE
jgi:arylsulfatase A-like enzyme